MEEWLCPFCNIDLEIDEIYDNTVDHKHHQEEWHGHCPECEKSFRWVRTFVYEGTSDIEEIKGET